MSRVAGGDDGNLYLLQPGDPWKVYVISIGGEVLRHFVVRRPAPYFDPIDLKVADGRVVVVFAAPAEPLNRAGSGIKPNLTLSLYEAASGELVGVYTTMEETPGMLACYSAKRGFTFWLRGTGQEPARIRHAQP
jgi:hypothetical protein